MDMRLKHIITTMVYCTLITEAAPGTPPTTLAVDAHEYAKVLIDMLEDADSLDELNLSDNS